MSLQVRFIFKIILAAFLLLPGCRLWLGDDPEVREERPSPPGNMFTVPGQLVNHPDLYSLQLHRSGSPQSPPILRMDSNQRLKLRFEMLEVRSRQFRIRFTHHNPDWSRSPLPPEFFLDGFGEFYFNGGTPSRTRQPSYRQYEFTFPNRDFSFTASGNYMLWVEDYETRDLLFTLPFFVHENQGEITSTVETIIVPRRDLRVQHQPRSRYHYPEFVDLPQFDLQFYFVQNQFWGRAQKADVFDVTSPGSVFYEVSRELSFIGDYEFRLLELPQLTQRGPDIIDYQPGYTPPRVILNYDSQGLGDLPRRIPFGRFGIPRPDLDARYGDLYFSLDPADDLPSGTEIYLVGDFNNWTIQSNYKLSYDPDDQLWKVNAFVKEGAYSYKYVLMEDGHIRDLFLDDTFTRNRQEYSTFVYFRDPERHYFRLLQSNTFFAN